MNSQEFLISQTLVSHNNFIYFPRKGCFLISKAAVEASKSYLRMKKHKLEEK